MNLRKSRASSFSVFILLIVFSIGVTTIMVYPDFANTSPSFDLVGENPDNLDEVLIQKQAQEIIRTRFYENLGQVANTEVLYYGQIPGALIGFGESSILLKLEGASTVTTLSFVGAFDVLPQGVDDLSHRTNFLLGERGTFTNVRSFQRIVYKNLWTGIDLVYKATVAGAKYEFQVSPGANPSDIRVKCDGYDRLSITADSVSIFRNNAAFVDDGLLVTQGDVVVQSSFIICEETTYGIDVGIYDPSRTLIIDPLVYSTYVGGTGDEYAGYGSSIYTNPAGHAIVVGLTSSADFPMEGDYTGTYVGNGDVFVIHIGANGELVFSTIIGGSEMDFGTGVFVDSNGNIHVTGYTTSSDFPTTTGSVDETHNGGRDIFILRLHRDGGYLIYSTFIGGSGNDFAYAIAADPWNRAFVCGKTDSTDYPCVDAANSTYLGGDWDAVYTKIDNTGASILFSGYWGGSETDIAYSIHEAHGLGHDLYIAGQTRSSDFPTDHPDWTFSGQSDTFVTNIEWNGTIIYSTLVGGTADEEIYGIDLVDDTMELVVTGFTNSNDFPTINAYDDSFNGGTWDVFLYKLQWDGKSLQFSTYIGGSSADTGSKPAVDSVGNIYVVGRTASSDFPVLNAYDDEYNGGSTFGDDVFVLKMSSSGDTLEYSTFIGGSSEDRSQGVAVDSEDNLYVVIETDSTDFPTGGTSPYSTVNSGGWDIVVFSFTGDMISPELSGIGISPTTPTSEDTVTVTASVTDAEIDTVTLYYNTGGSDTVVPMTHATGNIWTAEIPAQSVGATLYYRVEAYDTAGNFVVSSTASYPVIAPATSPPTTTTTATTGAALDPMLIMGGGGIGLIAIISIIVIMKRKPKPPVGVVIVDEPEEPGEGVQALRGCAAVGGKFEYKVKVKNDSLFVINNVTVTIVAYPEDCMEVSGETTKKISRIEPNGFRSPQFTFIPTKDCVEGQILAAVTYVDHANELETIEVEPYTIRSVCDLLEPLQATMEDFDLMLGDMSASREEVMINWNPEVLFSKAEKLLPNRNFHILESSSSIEGGLFHGTIRGLAEGKYTQKKVAVRIVITGPVDAEVSKVIVEGLGDDEAMLPTTIEEITKGMDSWICMHCGSGLDPDDVTKIKSGAPHECQYCGRTMSIELYRK